MDAPFGQQGDKERDLAMAKKATEATQETGKEATEITETSTPKDSLTQPLGDTEGEILKAPHEEEQESNAESVEDMGGLFEDESKHSEEDLTGIDSEKEAKEKSEAEEKKKEEEAAAAKSKDEDKKVGEKKEAKAKEGAEAVKAKEDEAKAKAEAEAKEKEASEKKDVIPPKGFVSKQALKEARDDIKALRDEVATLKATPTTPRETKADAKWKDFKELSNKEYDELVDEDPQEAMKYSHRLEQFKEYKSEKKKAENQTQDNQRKFDSMVDEWTEKINEAVPGVYEEDSEVGSGLADVAKELGFEDENYLSVMTDPRTMVIPHGQKETFFLGPGVMGLLKVLSNAKSKIKTASGADEGTLREEITKELTAEITKKVTKQITEKLKGAKGEEFKSITDVPGGGDEVELGVEPQSEEDWAKLKRTNPEKAKELLGG